MNRPRPIQNMQSWQVGPVPDYAAVYHPSTAQPQNDMHQQQQHPYGQDMNRRNEHFAYGGHQPGMPQPHQQQQQPHHPGPVQPPMSVSQQQSNTPTSQHATPTQTPTQPPRQRKRPAPSAAPPPITSGPAASATTVTPSQTHPPLSGPPIHSPAPGAVQHNQGAPPPLQGAPIATGGDDSTVMPTPPPAKKSRTNTPWTPQEELRLKQMRDAGNSWAEIAKTFPTRTEGSVKKHWYKDMHYAEFAEDESQALMNAIKEYENNKWKAIGQKVGKPAKACEQYAKEHFPDLFGPSKGH